MSSALAYQGTLPVLAAVTQIGGNQDVVPDKGGQRPHAAADLVRRGSSSQPLGCLPPRTSSVHENGGSSTSGCASNTSISVAPVLPPVDFSTSKRRTRPVKATSTRSHFSVNHPVSPVTEGLSQRDRERRMAARCARRSSFGAARGVVLCSEVTRELNARAVVTRVHL